MKEKHIFWLAGAAVFIITFVLFSYSLNSQFIDWGGYGGIDYSVWSKSPFICHLSSVILHSINAFLFFVFSFIFLNSTDLSKYGKDSAMLVFPAFFSALFFAVHPLRTEAVAWVSPHSVVLSSFFFLLCLLSYYRYTENKQVPAKNRKFYIFSVVLCFFAVLTNIIAAVIPFLLILLDYFPLRRLIFSEDKTIKLFLSENKRIFKEKIPFFAVAVVFSAISCFGVGNQVENPEYYVPPLYKGIYVCGFYLIKTLFPFGLIPIYQIPQGLVVPNIISLASMFSLGAVSWHFRHKNPVFIFAFLYYVIALIPLFFLLIGDRYTYMSMLSVAILFGYLCGKMAFSLKNGRKFIYAAFATVPVLFAGIAFFQQKAWTDSESLWLHELEYNKNCSVAWDGLARKQYGNKNYGMALMYITKAIELNPGHLPYKCDAAKIHLAMGNAETAFSLFSSALAINPARYVIADRICNLYFEDEDIFKKNKAFIDSIRMRRSIATSLYSAGQQLINAERYSEADKITENLVNIMPGNPDAMSLRAYSLAGLGNISAAQKMCHEVLEISPENREAAALLRQYPELQMGN